MSNWMTLNQSAIQEQEKVAQTADPGVTTLTQINIYNQQYGDEYEWEAIGGGHE